MYHSKSALARDPPSPTDPENTQAPVGFSNCCGDFHDRSTTDFPFGHVSSYVTFILRFAMRWMSQEGAPNQSIAYTADDMH